MAGNARLRHSAEFMRAMYPAFSRRATQVCILSRALERIATGAADASAIALDALDQADAFGWKQRRPSDDEIRAVWNRTQNPIATVREFIETDLEAEAVRAALGETKREG